MATRLFGITIFLLIILHCFDSVSEVALLYKAVQVIFLFLSGYELLIPRKHKKSYILSIRYDIFRLLLPQILIWACTWNVSYHEPDLLAVLFCTRLVYNLSHTIFFKKGKAFTRTVSWSLLFIFGMTGFFVCLFSSYANNTAVIPAAFLPVLLGNIFQHYVRPTIHSFRIYIPVLSDLISSCAGHPFVWIYVLCSDTILSGEWQAQTTALSFLYHLCMDIAMAIIIILILLQVSRKNTGSKHPDQIMCRKYLRISDIFYYITLSAALVRSTLGSTLLTELLNKDVIQWVAQFSLILIHISILTFAISLCTVKSRIQIAVEMFSLIAFFIWHRHVPNSIVILYLIALTLGATGKNLRTMLKIYIGVKVPILIAAFFASQHGFIYNKVTFGFNEIGRHSLGIINSTDCAAHILFLIIAYCILKPRNRSWKSFIDYLILLLLTEYCYHLTGARANMLWMLLAISITFIFHIGAFINWPGLCRKIFRTLCFAITPIYLFLLWISYIAVKTYGTDNSIISSITARFTDTGLIQRLLIPQRAIEKYGISLIGCVTSYPDIGYGGHTTSISNYSYIDMSYMRLLILFGIIITAALMNIFLFMNIRCVIKHEYFLFAMLVLIAFTGLIEQHLYEFYYNILILAAFSNYGGKIFRGNTRHDKA